MERFKTLKDHVYDYIAEQILEGNLLPEEKINENVICEELNISRTPVREALIQLASEGVLKNRARKGFVVRDLSPGEVAEYYGVIGVLDGYAARAAVNRLTEKDLANMTFYVESMDVAINSSNYEMYHAQQLAFHDVYIQKCGNNVLIETLDNMKNKLIKKKYVDDPEGNTQEILRMTNQEHREMVEMFREKRGEDLFRYMSEVHWRPVNAEFDPNSQKETK